MNGKMAKTNKERVAQHRGRRREQDPDRYLKMRRDEMAAYRTAKSKTMSEKEKDVQREKERVRKAKQRHMKRQGTTPTPAPSTSNEENVFPSSQSLGMPNLNDRCPGCSL